jgi:hypothetical protein
MSTLQFFTCTNCLEAYDPVDVRHRPAGTELFALEMFLVDIGNGRNEWYGSLQNINNGEKHYFKGWSGLVANLQGLLTPSVQMEILRAILPLDAAAS